MAPSPDYAHLAARVRGGDRDAFDALVRAHWPRIRGYLWRRAGDGADDLAQTVFVNVYRGLRRGAGSGLAERADWSRYLFAAARNVWRDHQRAAGRAASALDGLLDAGSEATSPEADAAGGATALAEGETRDALEACLGELAVPDRELVWLHFVDGRRKRELARALGRPESSLRSELTRILERLRRCLTGRGVEP